MLDPLPADPFPPVPDYHGHTTRLATPEERRYLRRFNWIRLMRYVMFWANFVFLGALAAMLFALPVLYFTSGDIGPALFMSVLVVILGVVYFAWWRPVLPDLIRMRPILQVPAQVQVLCLHDGLTAIAHPTSQYQNIYRLQAQRRTLPEVPAHWDGILAERDQDPGAAFPIEIARLSGASGKVLRLKMFEQDRSRRIDPTLPDLGDFVLRYDDLSVTREMRAGLPLIRANHSFGLFGFSNMLLGLIAASLFWVFLDLHNDDAARLAAEIAGISAVYDGGGSVPAEGLAARGWGDLRPDAEFGQRVLSAGPVPLHEVRLPGRAQPFYLTADELSTLLHISTIFPRTLVGYGQPSAELIAEYRALLTARIAALGAVPHTIAQATEDLPDGLVARQLQALSLGNTPDPDFIAALLPQPMIVPPTETNPYFIRPLPVCHPDDTLCGQHDAAITPTATVFTAQDGVVILQSTAELERLAQARTELAALNADVGPYRRLQVCAAITLLAAMALLSSLLAGWRVRRWYRQQAGHPAA